MTLTTERREGIRKSAHSLLSGGEGGYYLYKHHAKSILEGVDALLSDCEALQQELASTKGLLVVEPSSTAMCTAEAMRQTHFVVAPTEECRCSCNPWCGCVCHSQQAEAKVTALEQENERLRLLLRGVRDTLNLFGNFPELRTCSEQITQSLEGAK